LKKLVGAILQFGIAKVISQNSDQIKKLGVAVLQNFFNKKEKISKKHSGSEDNN